MIPSYLINRENRNNKMGRYLQLLGVLTILGLFPIKKMLISEWEVTVTDGSNNPIPHVRVSQNWQNYTLSISGGSDLYTNAEGKVLLGKYERRARGTPAPPLPSHRRRMRQHRHRCRLRARPPAFPIPA